MAWTATVVASAMRALTSGTIASLDCERLSIPRSGTGTVPTERFQAAAWAAVVTLGWGKEPE
jgi:hypothetical protein